jgi:hypothetical protein
MDMLIKDYAQTKTEFKVEKKGEVYQSINKMGQVFHFLDLNYLKEGIFYHGWIGYRTNEQIKEVLDGHFMELYRKQKCTKMMIENSKMTGTFAALNDWLNTYFMPKMINQGLTHNAVVFPENVFAQLSVEDWDQKVGGFHNKSFKSISEALSWLRSV